MMLLPVSIILLSSFSGHTGVNNTGSGGKNGGRTILNGLVNTPVLTCRRGTGNGTVIQIYEQLKTSKRDCAMYVKVIEPVNLELSVPPMEILELELNSSVINAPHTPGNFSIQFRGGGPGNRFKRDTNFVGANGTSREKVVSDGRDWSARARRQGFYIECQKTATVEIERENN